MLPINKNKVYTELFHSNIITDNEGEIEQEFEPKAW